MFQVSDGVIAPGYTDEALEILKNKRAGKYCVLQVSIMTNVIDHCSIATETFTALVPNLTIVYLRSKVLANF